MESSWSGTLLKEVRYLGILPASLLPLGFSGTMRLHTSSAHAQKQQGQLTMDLNLCNCELTKLTGCMVIRWQKDDWLCESFLTRRMFGKRSLWSPRLGQKSIQSPTDSFFFREGQLLCHKDVQAASSFNTAWQACEFLTRVTLPSLDYPSDDWAPVISHRLLISKRPLGVSTWLSYAYFMTR